MKVLVVGSGGREHALAWAMSKSSQCQEIHLWPGNPGMSSLDKVIFPDEKILSSITFDSEFKMLGDYCLDKKIDFVLIGPEVPLSLGMADVLRQRGINCLGPSQMASRLESSKSFAKDFMARFHIPTAFYAKAKSAQEAHTILDKWPKDDKNQKPPVIKAVELWAGKGVVVPENWPEAYKTVDDFFTPNHSGIHPQEVVIEEHLKGEELSLFVLCHKQDYLILGAAQDYKRLYDQHQGPNTGGMGAHGARKGLVDQALLDQIEQEIIIPTLKGRQEENHAFSGVLFLGLMIDQKRAKVIEYNVRLGDPETQVLMPSLVNLGVDVAKLFEAASRGVIDKSFQQILKQHIINPQFQSVHVVLTSKGYALEGPMLTGQEIKIRSPIENKSGQGPYLFYAGVKKRGELLCNQGGRVLGVSALGEDLNQAKNFCYQSMEKISLEGGHYRRDIGL